MKSCSSIYLPVYLYILQLFESCNLSGGLLIRSGNTVGKVVILVGYRLQSQS